MDNRCIRPSVFDWDVGERHGVGDPTGVGLDAGSTSATASLTWDFILTVTGGYGDGYAEPELSVGADSYGGVGWGDASASLGGCWMNASGGTPPGGCSPTSVAFVFGVPQTLTLFESADASAGYFYGVPPVGGAASMSGFEFFKAYGQPLSGFTYTFVPADQPSATPEPDTLALAAMACAFLIAFERRRRSRYRKVARPAR